jgi:quinol monooxygenase YgiN
MIVRIVKMTFQTEAVPEFLHIMKKSHHRIRSSTGCISLEVIQDLYQQNVFFTYSKWEDESNLNDYRNSEIFHEVWPATKALFAAKPETWTLQPLTF